MKNNNSTIQNFGDQWNIFQENMGYYASQEIFEDIINPLMKTEDFENRKVAEVGSGTGRIINMLSKLNLNRIYAIEPSDSFEILESVNYENKTNINFIKSRGQDFKLPEKIDILLSIGVLHHIPDPEKVVQNSLINLKKGGTIFIWVYAKEGNEIYLFFFKLIHIFTSKIKDKYLMKFVNFLYVFLKIYIYLCRYIKLPMRKYMLNVIGKMSAKNQN